MTDIALLPRPRRYVMAFMAGLSWAARLSTDLYLIELVSAVAVDSMGRQGEN